MAVAGCDLALWMMKQDSRTQRARGTARKVSILVDIAREQSKISVDEVGVACRPRYSSTPVSQLARHLKVSVADYRWLIIWGRFIL